MFPDTFPMPEVIELVTLIRQGKAKEDLVHVAKLGLWISGCTLETFFTDQVGLPDDSVETLEASSYSIKSLSSEPPADIDEALKVVDELGPKGEVSTRAINPALILAIIQLVKLILEQKAKA